MMKYDSFRRTVKYVITPKTPKLLLKKATFSFMKYKNGWKEHDFWRQKNEKK